MNTGFDLWILPVRPDGKPAPNAALRPYLRSQFNEWNGRFSPEPEPRSVAYESDESGHYEAYIDAFPTAHEKVAISTGWGRYPQWSPDGRKLFYISLDKSLMEVSLERRGAGPVELSSPHKLFTLPIIETGLSPYEVAPDGQHFLVRATPEGQARQPLTLIVNWTALLTKGTAVE